MTADVIQALPKTSTWARWLVRIGLVWAAILMVSMATSDDPTPEDQTHAVAITLSGVYTVLLYLTRRWWLPRLADRPQRNAMILGSLNAAVIETLFLAVQRMFGAEGVAAHPNLIIDLLVTMPWYIGMVVIFVKVQHRRRFTCSTVLLLGAVYECGADGLVGGGLNGMLLDPTFFPMLFLIFFWAFIPVYSSMVLPPAWLIATTPPAAPPLRPAWRDALRPLVWLAPFVLYLGVFFVIAAVLSGI